MSYKHLIVSLVGVATVFGILGTVNYMNAPAEQDFTVELDEAHFLFADFMDTHEKEYEDERVKEYRFNIFQDNVRKIREHNSKNLPWTMGVNQFADLTAEEFKHIFASSYMPERKESENLHVADPNVELPSSVDWRTSGAVTPVKNQGQCGSCWSFSTTGAIEGACQIAGHSLTPISEQEFVDCDTVDSACNGGLMDYAFEFAMSNYLCTETSYPYTARKGSYCQKSYCTHAIERGKITGYTDVSHSETALMSAVAQQPVAIAIEADQSAFQFYHSGVMTGTCGSSLDHGVLLVGYGTESSTDYWIVKNSWGPGWGDQGYIKIQRGASQSGGKCGILLGASYPQCVL